jgi:cytochrome c oxidase subunit 4
LLLLLGLTVLGAYQPLGTFNTALALTIALCKALLVAAIFMELRRGDGVTLAVAGAGFFWLAIMLWLAFADYANRPVFPPSKGTSAALQFGEGENLRSNLVIRLPIS